MARPVIYLQVFDACRPHLGAFLTDLDQSPDRCRGYCSCARMLWASPTQLRMGLRREKLTETRNQKLSVSQRVDGLKVLQNK